jgi:hypothetical protein
MRVSRKRVIRLMRREKTSGRGGRSGSSRPQAAASVSRSPRTFSRRSSRRASPKVPGSATRRSCRVNAAVSCSSQRSWTSFRASSSAERSVSGTTATWWGWHSTWPWAACARTWDCSITRTGASPYASQGTRLSSGSRDDVQMSARADCYDSAVMESFLKVERGEQCASHDAAQPAVFEYIGVLQSATPSLHDWASQPGTLRPMGQSERQHQESFVTSAANGRYGPRAGATLRPPSWLQRVRPPASVCPTSVLPSRPPRSTVA